MKLPSKKSIIIGVSSLALIATAGTSALISTQPASKPKDAIVTVTDQPQPSQPVQTTPVVAPAPVDTTPTPAATTPPATAAPAPVPAAPIAVDTTQRQDWMQQAGITEPYAAVDGVLKYSNWDPMFSIAGRHGMCSHLILNLRVVTNNPVAQLRDCNTYIRAQFGTWQNAADVLAARNA